MKELSIALPLRPRGVALLAPGNTWPVAPTPHVAPSPEQLRLESQSIERALVRVTHAIGGLQAERAAEAHAWRTAAVELALAVAAKLLRRTIDADEFPLEAMVREMTAGIPAGAIAIFLNPDDLTILRTRLEDPALLAEAMRLRADASLPRGDARVEAGDEVIVSQLADQFAALRGEMLRSAAHDAR